MSSIPQGDNIHRPVIVGALDARTVALPYHSPAQVNPPRDVTVQSTLSKLPPYTAEPVRAGDAGIETSRRFAKRRGISITDASERLPVARRLGSIVPVDGQYLSREGIRYTANPPHGSNGASFRHQLAVHNEKRTGKSIVKTAPSPYPREPGAARGEFPDSRTGL
jgi:hypothetical protein